MTRTPIVVLHPSVFNLKEAKEQLERAGYIVIVAGDGGVVVHKLSEEEES